MKLPKLSPRKEILVDFLLVFLFTVVLIKPYFKAKYEDKWGSIESTFIADARFLSEHLPHPQWQPLWYAGTRFDYIYPPMLRYGTALLIKATHFWPVKAYHFYISCFYALGIAAVYLMMRVGTKSRACAWLGAVATSLMSPIFLFMPRYRGDAWKLNPQRLGVLVKYGEGPHMSALALIPLALAFTWLALEKRRPWAIVAAAICSAGVVSTNFYGATALAVFYPVLVWAFWITRQEKRIAVPALAIPALAYGMTAFWLVPSYFKVTAENLKYVSEHGTTWSIWVAAVVAVIFAVTTDKVARAKPKHTWSVFVMGSVVFFTLNVLGNYYFHFLVAGDPHRLLPELDMIYIMAIVLLLRWMWERPGIAGRIVAGAIVLAAFYTTKGYVHHAWDMFPVEPDYQSRIEYRVSEWLNQNMPNSRTWPTGSVRFWYDAWHDLSQLSGGSDQGMLNTQVEPASWETDLGPRIQPTVLWMQAMGVDAIFVSDKRSQETFKDFEYPGKFEGALQPVFDDGSGNFIYRVPRRYTVLARVVETAKLKTVKPPRANDDVENLGAYVDMLEKGPDTEPTLKFDGTDAFVVHAKVEAGQSVLVQETYDTTWRATAGGQVLPIHKDVMDFMSVDAPPGEQDIRFEFLTPLENRVGRIVTLLTLLVFICLAAFNRRMEPLV